MGKICQFCQEPIIQRANENNYRYQRRKFCSQYCYNKYMRTNKLGWYAHFPNPAPPEPEPLTEEKTKDL